jgi:hypothetical protein
VCLQLVSRILRTASLIRRFVRLSLTFLVPLAALYPIARFLPIGAQEDGVAVWWWRFLVWYVNWALGSSFAVALDDILHVCVGCIQCICAPMLNSMIRESQPNDRALPRPAWPARRQLEQGGPTAIKFGQWAGTRRDLFSDGFCNHVSQLHAASKIHRLSHTRYVRGTKCSWHPA